jgi:hypothetical protein
MSKKPVKKANATPVSTPAMKTSVAANNNGTARTLVQERPRTAASGIAAVFKPAAAPSAPKSPISPLAAAPKAQAIVPVPAQKPTTPQPAPKPLQASATAPSSSLVVTKPQTLVPAPAAKPAQAPAAAVTKPKETPATTTMLKQPVALIAAESKPVAPASKPQEKPVAVKETPTSAATRTVKVAFVLDAPQARQVSVCGDFNDWEPESILLRRQNGGQWETTVALPPGRYSYKFVADGQWLHDPKAPENVPNEHGSLNSVIQIRA